MYKKIIMSVFFAGSMCATVMDKVDLTLSGIVLITEGNTANIGKNERWFLINARNMDPVLRSLIKACHGKPTDVLMRVVDGSVSVMTDFTKVRVKEQDVPKKVYKNCIGFIANENGSCDYFCKGSHIHILGDAINTQANAVGIAENDVCYLARDKKTIHCTSGKVLENPVQRESALTGTPGHLSGTGYIGLMVSKPSTPSLMGSGKRIDFYQR